MRFKIIFKVVSKEHLLPLNYQYELSSWIYKVLNLGDATFSSWLHNQGYGASNKHYKLFTFSRLQVPQFKIHQDRLQLLSSTVSLLLSFYTPVTAETFITGLFRQQQFQLGDSQSQVSLEVAQIITEPMPALTGKTRFRLLSPLCASTLHLQQGKPMPLYLAPDAPEFEKILTENLRNKYLAGGLPPAALPPPLPATSLPLTLLSKPVSKLITIKANTRQQTKVRGYLFDFEWPAPAALLEVGYYAGFGEKGSLGFGCAEVLQ